MKTWRIFIAVLGVIGGVLVIATASGDNAGAQAFFGVIFLAGGLTYLWKLSGFRGLKPK